MSCLRFSIFLLFVLMPIKSFSDNFSNFHLGYLKGTLVESKMINVNNVDSDILMSILDKVYEKETKTCEEYGIAANLSNYNFNIRNNPFAVIKISKDNNYDIIIDEKEFNCGDSNAVYRGGTGGHIFKILLNPSINSINNWFDENKKTPLINEKKNTMSEYGIYNVFARSWTMLDNQFVISIHGSSCDIAGYQECFKRYEASFEKGFSQIGDTSSKLK